MWTVARPPAVAAALALLAGSCPALAGEAPASCQGTLGGAVTGSFTCLAGAVPGDDGQVFFVITALDAVRGVVTYQPGSFELRRPVAPGTYTLETLGVGMATVAAEGGTLFSATKTSSQRGEVTLSLRSVTPDPARPGGFAVHGSLRARLLPAGAGKTGEVVVEVRF